MLIIFLSPNHTSFTIFGYVSHFLLLNFQVCIVKFWLLQPRPLFFFNVLFIIVRLTYFILSSTMKSSLITRATLGDTSDDKCIGNYLSDQFQGSKNNVYMWFAFIQLKCKNDIVMYIIANDTKLSVNLRRKKLINRVR